MSKNNLAYNLEKFEESPSAKETKIHVRRKTENPIIKRSQRSVYTVKTQL